LAARDRQGDARLAQRGGGRRAPGPERPEGDHPQGDRRGLRLPSDRAGRPGEDGRVPDAADGAAERPALRQVAVGYFGGAPAGGSGAGLAGLLGAATTIISPIPKRTARIAQPTPAPQVSIHMSRTSWWPMSGSKAESAERTISMIPNRIDPPIEAQNPAPRSD